MAFEGLSPSVIVAAVAVVVALFVRSLFTVPAELRHLPVVPIIPTLLSYAKGEVEDVRIKKLMLPFAERGEPVVVVYALGRWIIHILDSRVAKSLSADIEAYPKEVPPDGLLLWRFVGLSNIILSNGPAWKRHSRVVKSALDRNVPIGEFAELARKLFRQMGNGGKLLWDDLTMRYTLDAVGSTAMGHSFNAIEEPESRFVKEYNHVMESIADPAYLVFPSLEKWWPRTHIIKAIDHLVEAFEGILKIKKAEPGNDMITYMLEDKDMTDEEYRDNMVVFFIAGHDTTAGAMSSLCYYMAKQPDLQKTAREEVKRVMKDNTTGEPTIAELKQMTFLSACIRESLRINTPITNVVPRLCKKTGVFTSSIGREVIIPEGSAFMINITAVHYNPQYWSDPDVFDPSRFTETVEGKENERDATQWLPFALGPRQCPARNFAIYEMRTLASMLLNEWEWTLPSDSPHADYIKNGFSPFALSLPKDLHLEFNKVQS